MWPLANKLEQSIPASYEESLKQRVLREHPEMSEREYEWRWLELQRFYVMCAVLDRVPMFSKAVDEVWHEMLMYTRDYQAFSEKYLGRMLHHSPNPAESVPIPGERAWFDFVYVELFGWNPYSERLWGRFFRHPIPREELEAYRDASAPPTQGGRFNAWAYDRLPEARKAIQSVKDALQFRLEVERAEDVRKPVNFNNTDVLLSSVIFFSMTDPANFSDYLTPEEQLKKEQSGSSCGGTACSSGSDDRRDHHGDVSHGSNHDSGSSCSDSGGSSDGGGSSCSSCGGGCSS
ncbi:MULTISPECIES: hypothetical protein [Paenibacillus]|uniref:hypothetical protein n=1 Tax=Paenibacillus TaxID=44249 RepID=UPI002FE2F197